MSLLLVLAPSWAGAGTIGTELWIGGGASWPDYNEKAMACIRGGAGLAFARHFTLGISGQADRQRHYYFADASVVFPALGMLEPYGRFQAGRRDNTDETAMGWAAGIRTGEDAIRVFAEAYGIFQPGYNYGLCVGISF